MAHFILEYSANLPKPQLALPELFARLHEEAVASGLFPLAGMRSRAYRAEDFRVASGDPGLGFVHLNFRIGAGRSDEQKTRIFTTLRDVVVNHFDELQRRRGVAVSFELTELPAALRHNHNNIRTYLS